MQMFLVQTFQIRKILHGYISYALFVIFLHLKLSKFVFHIFQVLPVISVSVLKVHNFFPHSVSCITLTFSLRLWIGLEYDLW